MLSNGFYLPPLKSAFTTQKFLLEVFNETCYCPKLSEVKFLPCLNPPTSDTLLEGIVNMIENNDHYVNEDEARRYKKLAMYMRRNKPDK